MSRHYRLGTDYPREGFVQQAIERHFAALGYRLDTSGDADLICRHPNTRDHWIIEAKGLTSDPGLDFHTGLGQLLTRLRQGSNHGIAFPDLPQFHRLTAQVPDWARQALNLHWVVVTPSGDVTVRAPAEV